MATSVSFFKIRLLRNKLNNGGTASAWFLRKILFSAFLNLVIIVKRILVKTQVLIKMYFFWNKHFRYIHTQIIAENWVLKCNSVKLSFCKSRDCQIFKKNYVNPLSDNPTKWWKTLKQFVGKLPTNFLSVFEHFVGLPFEELMNECRISIHKP